MGIYIANIEMPENCYKCRLQVWTSPNGVTVSSWCAVMKEKIYPIDLDKKRANCPLIEIPTPHGRLIDGDLLRDEYYRAMDELLKSTTTNISEEALSILCGCTLANTIPTIIEAEE